MVTALHASVGLCHADPRRRSDREVRRAGRRPAAAGAGGLPRRRGADSDAHRGRRSGRAGRRAAGKRRRRGAGNCRRRGARPAAGRARQRPELHVHRGRTRLDDVRALPLRPGVVEHPGQLHQRVDREPAGRVPANQRRQPGARPPGLGPGPPRVQIRPGRSRLPQAVLGHPPGRPRRAAPADRPRPSRGGGRHLQRTVDQPHRRRDDDSESGGGHRFSARHPGCRSRDGLAARRVRPRPAISRAGGRRRAELQRLGARTVSPVGADGGRRRSAPHAVRIRVRMDCAVGAWPADALHARALRRRLVDGRQCVVGRRRGRGLRTVHRAEEGRRHPQRAAAGGHRLHPAQPVDHRNPPGLGTPATPGRSSSAPCRGSSSPRCAPNSSSATRRRRRRPAT